MFLLNSRQKNFSCGPSCEGQTLSQSYGRFFAEFLNEESLVPLGLLALFTCVGLRYGINTVNLRSFSWEALRLNCTDKNQHFSRDANVAFAALRRICLSQHSFSRKRQTIKTLNPFSFVPPLDPDLHRDLLSQGRNINRLSISCGFRHCLRTA